VGQRGSQRLELEPSASWVVSQKIAQGTKSFVVFLAFRNIVSMTIADICAIHVRPPPDRPRTNAVLCPGIHGPFPWFWTWGARLPRAYHFVSFESFMVSTAVFRLSLPGAPPASAGPRNINLDYHRATNA